jgi:hypothetical protein
LVGDCRIRTEMIEHAKSSWTLDTQLGKLRRRSQVADLAQELLYKVAQIFPISPADCTTLISFLRHSREPNYSFCEGATDAHKRALVCFAFRFCRSRGIPRPEEEGHIQICAIAHASMTTHGRRVPAAKKAHDPDATSAMSAASRSMKLL